MGQTRRSWRKNMKRRCGVRMASPRTRMAYRRGHAWKYYLLSMHEENFTTSDTEKTTVRYSLGIGRRKRRCVL
jgi:hypothetical protein